MKQSCEICASPAKHTFSKDSLAYSRCAACGFIFARPAHNANFQQALDEFEKAYLDYFQKPAAVDLANFEALQRWICRHVPKMEGPILDLGCGGGSFVRYLRSRGYDAVGFEPAEVLYNAFLSRESFFERKSIEQAAGEQARFQIITLLDVVEHLADPVETLASVRDVLAPGGWLFLSTPDTDSLMAKLWGRHWHFYHRYHLSMFSPRNLALLLERSGFRIASCRHMGKRYSLGYLAQYLFDLVLRRPKEIAGRLWDRVTIPINSGEILYVSAQKR